MPVARANIRDLVFGSAARSLSSNGRLQPDTELPLIMKTTGTLEATEFTVSKYELSANVTYFPRSQVERASFRTKAGKKVTPHQWAVYDHILSIPQGNVATYKSVCDALGQGSPRSVGLALRNNPFAPYVPCHRVISSDLYLGGYCGEWGPQSKTGTQFNRKLELLRDEGVDFDANGMLQSKEKLM